ncbi:molybdopterin-dependent oxidoreductase [Sporichthya polymorpha]|uniref:molybdopterin-dependent oxidoreductase n=1 Tax=Sporichthya polymorpha TaxID=35751 RepID=UPI00036E4738|nr:molybdopterin-dependent oxidoreductase [Sporichthya polymorpha]
MSATLGNYVSANPLNLGNYVSADKFYRIDTALRVPTPGLDAWRLRVTGLVDQPLSLTYAELSELPQIQADVTLTCVGNQVGGDLVGTARWQGVVQTVLDRAQVRGVADQLVGRSTDDFTAGFPVGLARDGRPALIALGMNGQPLPFEHGFPARLVVSGLYGYCSATKWLTEIELTRFDSFTAYWRQRGWSEPAPIATQARIDTPRSEARLRPGPVQVGGVAWSQHRGIRAVEVAIDEGPWMRAALARELSVDSWRLWTYTWMATPGRHVLRVRATDGSGTLQPQGERQPFPSGASGWHTIAVTMT